MDRMLVDKTQEDLLKDLPGLLGCLVDDLATTSSRMRDAIKITEDSKFEVSVFGIFAMLGAERRACLETISRIMGIMDELRMRTEALSIVQDEINLRGAKPR